MPEITRRSLVGGGIALSGAVLLSACSRTDASSLVSPGDDIVDMTEAGRPSTGRERKFTLTAAETELDLGGTRVRTWSYGGGLPGPELRVSAGDTVAATLVNNLPDPTSVHWHGLALRNDMDGVPHLTQEQVAPGERFDYRFIAANPGTHWFHPHVGTQFDRGLYAPIIVEDPRERQSYDQEWVIVLDDWLDGVENTPDEVLEELRAGMDHGGHGMGEGGGPMRMGSTLMGATSDLLGGDAGDVYYPMHLVSGRPPNDPRTFEAAPGDRVRIRLINAGADTAYRVALGGHTMTVTHTDGYAVEHTEADALLMGMGERYDVLATLADGVFPFVALAEGKDATGLALVRTGSGSVPDPRVRPEELDGRVLVATDLTAEESVRLDAAEPDVVHEIRLTGSMADFDWGLNGRAYDHEDPTAAAFTVSHGQRVRLVLTNTTDMWHPMHLHGHHVQIGTDGPRKDTLNVLPGQTLTCDFDADNPGLWMTHCHNLYHGESGMMGVVAYTA
ncbi:multicopper oxidase family protein [Nocardiopsis dassonvillei]|uniref:multicopper oxidase family protein n=1 Tax=Nocardiopsis dassonvillei TaxID=2014 RepID=UPI00034D6AC9|nr:multicopper oxidase family protein [Nocardiopsis dassonvillei]MCK9872369.1 multicopper oxidase family protein [Nocardiopsis dassonvillei]